MRLGIRRLGFWAAALIVLGMAMTLSASGAERLLGRTWLAEDIGGGGVIDKAQSTLSFAPGGKVAGSGGCNRLFGAARIEGSNLMLGALGTTRMACAPAVMDQERRFLAALAATRTFRSEGPYLKFYDSAGAELVRFTQLR